MVIACRMTLLLGPPASGKSTLLLALAGKLDPKLKVPSYFSSFETIYFCFIAKGKKEFYFCNKIKYLDM